MSETGDSDCVNVGYELRPDLVDIPIPANDDAIRSIKLIVGRLADAIYEGRHGQLDMEEDYEDYEGAEEDLDYEESEYTDSVIPNEEEETEEE